MTSVYERLQPQDFERIEAVIHHLGNDFRSQPALSDLAACAGMSESHLQRLFSRWVGVSPKRFLEYLTVEHAKAALAAGGDVLGASLDAGLSGPGRLHDHFVQLEALTPGEFKKRCGGMTIHYGASPSPFGTCLLAWTDRGICSLRFVRRDEIATEVRSLLATFGDAEWIHADAETCRLMATRIFGAGSDREPLHLWVRGTNFQIRVWEALLRIPAGQLACYGDVAREIGRPDATRAVAGAIGANEIAWLIPCHRVIRREGLIGGYRWGCERKKAMIAAEAAGICSERIPTQVQHT